VASNDVVRFLFNAGGSFSAAKFLFLLSGDDGGVTNSKGVKGMEEVPIVLSESMVMIGVNRLLVCISIG